VRHPTLAPWVVVACTAAFGVALATRDLVNPWISNAGAAAAALALSVWILGPRLRALLAFRLPSALFAAGLGILLVAATHAGYDATTALFPALEAIVAELYRDIETSPPGIATALVIAMVVLAEEVLWRGVAVEVFERHLTQFGAFAGATVLYAIPQVIGGSWLLVATALALGALFTAQRLHTGRLTEPLITHTIWSVSVFFAIPLG
jgi:uncharacterized protein